MWLLTDMIKARFLVNMLVLIAVLALAAGSVPYPADGAKYLFPIVTNHGFGNQYKDLVGAIALALAWNRTLVLSPFMASVSHANRMHMPHKKRAHRLENMFDIKEIATMVPVISLPLALARCPRIEHVFVFQEVNLVNNNGIRS